MSAITILQKKETFIKKDLSSCSCWNSILFPENKQRTQGQKRKTGVEGGQNRKKKEKVETASALVLISYAHRCC